MMTKSFLLLLLPVVASLCLLSCKSMVGIAKRHQDKDWAPLLPYTHVNMKREGPETRTRFFREKDSFVVIVHCVEPDMTKLITKVTEKDDENVFCDDSVEVFIASEKENYFHFICNTAAVFYDKYHTSSFKLEWGSSAEVEVQKGDGYYQTTIRFPIQNLLREKSVTPWPINICRNRRTVTGPLLITC